MCVLSILCYSFCALTVFSRLLVVKGDLHGAWDRHELVITPEIDWLELAVEQVRKLNEERKRLAEEDQTLFPLRLFVSCHLSAVSPVTDKSAQNNLPKLETDLGHSCRFALYSLKPNPLYPTSFNKILPPLPGSKRARTVAYSADDPDGLFRTESGEELKPEAFSRPTEPWQHRPNPYLFALNAAAKLLVHRGEIPCATLKPLLLCLELVSQTFRFAPTDAPADDGLPADLALQDERARMWAQQMQELRTPAKRNDAGRQKTSAKGKGKK